MKTYPFYRYTDTEDLYHSNLYLPEKRKLLQLNNWTADNISYKENSEGFRSSEFVEGGILCLGCSLTLGLGLDEDNIWPNILGQALGIPVNNLGLPAFSNDGCFRLADHYITTLKPRMVFMLTPSKNRFEIKIDEGYRSLIPAYLYPNMQKYHKERGIEDYIPFLKNWVANNENFELNFKKNVLAIKSLCGEVPFFHQTAEETRELTIEGDLARDLVHPGRKWQHIIASKFIDMAMNN